MPAFKKIAKVTGKILLWSFFVLFLLFFAVSGAGLIYWNWYLPDFITARVLPPCREKFGLDEVDLKIRRIGLTGLDLEAVELADENGKTLRIDSIRADYTPHLPFRTPRMLEITNLTLSGGEISFAVRDGKFTVAGLNLERVLEKIRKLSTPAAEAVPDADGAPVTLEQITLRDLKLQADLNGKILVVPVNAVVTSTGNRWKQIHAELALSPRGQKLNMTVDFDSETGSLKVDGNARLRPESFADLTGCQTSFQLGLSFQSTTSFATGDIRSVGTIDAAVAPGGELPVTFDRELKLHNTFDLRYRTQEKELYAIFNGETTPPALYFDGRTIAARTTDPIRWKFALSSTPEQFQLSEASCSAAGVQIDAHGYQLTLPLLRLEQPAGRLFISATGARLNHPQLKLACSAIDLAIPVFPSEQQPATLTVGSIRKGEYELGAIRSSFFVRENEMRMKGDFVNKLIPGARVDFRGEVIPRSGKLPDLLFEMNVPPWSPKQPIALKQIRPAFGDATAAGVVSLGGAARFQNGKLTTAVQLLLENGSFQWPEMKLSADNIRLDLRFTDLLSMDTPAGQTLRIGRLDYDKLQFTDLELQLNLESKELAILEKASVKWCGGEVMLHGLKLRLDNPQNFNLKTQLYCENLELSRMLTELKLCNAAGSGALYGKIPVSFSSQRGLSIDSSYLYSRPGNINTIKLTDPEKIAGGMGDAVMRQSQLDFATEALKDFTYEWAKVNFSTAGGDLKVSLQFDGQPNQPLPFAYDDNSGQLRRDPTAQARFQGIQLNINTTVPLARLLKLNEKYQQFKGDKK